MARLAALSLCLLVVVGCAAPPAPAPPPAPPARPAPSPSPSPAPLADGTIPTTDPSVHVFLWGNAGTTARDLQLARDAGFHWVKQRFEWRNIEGKARGEFEWNEPDRIVDAITQAGLRVVARVDNQPQWASTSIQWPGSGPPDDLKDWSDFLSALAARYRGRIQAYEIWNEPNLDREWGNKKPDANAYSTMLKASYQAIKSADPQALVVSAGMSPTTDTSEHAVPDVQFISQMYAAGARGSFDVLGVHAAGYKAEPGRASVVQPISRMLICLSVSPCWTISARTSSTWRKA